MSTTDDYLNLFTSQHRGKPRLTAMASVSLDLEVYLQGLMASLIDRFDLDQAAGDQLDILGQWVGIARKLPVPISGVFFSWDDPTGAIGWDFGTWQPALAPTTVTSLPDDAYLTLIRARIAANHWDGTTEGAYAIWDAVFPGLTILVQDFGNMTFAVALVGRAVDALTMALLTGGYFSLRPETIRITEYFVSATTDPLFAWDLDATDTRGWDIGAWGTEIIPS